MLTLKDLKKNKNDLKAKLAAETEKQNKGSSKFQEDDRFWSPEVDAAGNGFAIIRFLPAHKSEDIPFVRMFEHGFKGPTGIWYVENSLTTIGKNDPVSEYNNKLWNSGNEEDKKLAQKYKRTLRFISNVLVVSDKKHPENEGKVKLFKYGKKIYDKWNALLTPEFEDEESCNPFDFWEGRNFKLKIRQVDGYRNYDKSEFEDVSPIADSDEAIEKIWSQVHPLLPFLDESNFKSYDELKARHAKALGLVGDVAVKAKVEVKDDNDEDEEEKEEQERRERKARQKKLEAASEASKPAAKSDDDDDDLEVFSSLAEDD